MQALLSWGDAHPPPEIHFLWPYCFDLCCNSCFFGCVNALLQRNSRILLVGGPPLPPAFMHFSHCFWPPVYVLLAWQLTFLNVNLISKAQPLVWSSIAECPLWSSLQTERMTFPGKKVSLGWPHSKPGKTMEPGCSQTGCRWGCRWGWLSWLPSQLPVSRRFCFAGCSLEMLKECLVVVLKDVA